MTHKSTYALLIMAVSFSGTAAFAQTAPPPVCTPGTLASYQAMTGDCRIGIELFMAFQFNDTGTGTAIGSLYSNSAIEVTPVSYSDNASAGFTFSLASGQPLSVSSGGTAQYNIQYEFSLQIDPVATNADLGMDPPFGNVTINQYYCEDAALNFNGPNGGPNCTYPANIAVLNFAPTVLTVNDTNPPVSWFTGNVELNPKINNFANVLTTINLDGTVGTAGFDSVTGSAFIDDFYPAPEPSTIVLVAGGLLAIALRGRFW